MYHVYEIWLLYVESTFVRSFFLLGGCLVLFLLFLLSTVPSGGFCGSFAFLAFWLRWIFVPAPRVFSAALETYSDGALHAADGADITVADDQAAGVDDAVADVAVDRNDADVTISLLIILTNNVIHSVINTSSLTISNIKISSISSINITIHNIINLT